MTRVGPRMHEVVQYVTNHQGCAKLGPAREVAPHGKGIAYGYRAVNRAIKAGLVVAERLTNRYSLTVPR